MHKTPIRTVAALLAILCAARASAQSRPLATEDPETVGAGQVLVEGGVDYMHDAFFPASGLKGNLQRIGMLGFCFGVSPIAEIQLRGGLRDRLTITSRTAAPLSDVLLVKGDTTSDVDDILIGAKVRFLSETANRPSMSVRFSTRLPNASANETGLGLGTTDFNFGVSIGKTVQSVRIVGNVGFGILGEVTNAYQQDDVFNYGISVARAVATGVEVVAELNGRLNTRSDKPPVGTENRSVVHLGVRYTHGAIRYDGAVLFGVAQNDPAWGVTGGFTWVFKAFTVPVS